MSKTKKIVALLLVLVMAMSMLSACGKGGTGGGTGNSGEPKDELNFAIMQDTGTLYPFAVSGGFVSLMYAFYEPSLRRTCCSPWRSVRTTPDFT